MEASCPENLFTLISEQNQIFWLIYHFRQQLTPDSIVQSRKIFFDFLFPARNQKHRYRWPNSTPDTIPAHIPHLSRPGRLYSMMAKTIWPSCQPCERRRSLGRRQRIFLSERIFRKGRTPAKRVVSWMGENSVLIGKDFSTIILPAR